MHVEHLSHRLKRIFLLQLIFISLATAIGVFLAAKVVESSLLQQAMAEESEHFWSNLRNNPSHPLPNTNNLRGYIADAADLSTLPEPLRGLSPGFFGRVEALPTRPVVLVSEQEGRRLFLLIDEKQISDLAFYFGTAPLMILLAVLYAVAWFGYMMSKRAVSPMAKLAREIRSWEFEELSGRGERLESLRSIADSDLLILIDALQAQADRLDDFIDRERRFTRDASHELRTPLTVIKGTVRLMEMDEDLSESDQRNLQRIRRTCEDMQATLNTILLLARTKHANVGEEQVLINDIVAEEVEHLQQTNIDRENIEYHLISHHLLSLHVPKEIITILIRSLLLNAVRYSKSGKLSIQIARQGLVLRDDGEGFDDEQLRQLFGRSEVDESYSGGLAMVQRLCQEYGWVLGVDSQGLEGSTVWVKFLTK